jgi:serine/threonine protein kinase
MENEFNILITIKNIKLDSVFMVEEKKTKKIFCIKKVFQNSEKNNINNYQKLFNDMTNKKNDKKLICDGYEFCNHFIDFWIEDENCDDEILFSAYTSQKYLYILNNYYPNGDLFDYLGKLELAKFIFTSNFYWDIIFEMLMGIKYFHELGYLHLDIKPTNFLVDEKGYLKLTDFGLCQRISEIPFLTDITEGDSQYISLELFHFSSNGVLDEKTDIFSLGLSILEIMAKIDLPKSGESWSNLRSGKFEIKEKLLQNWNIKENKKIFIELISKMIAPINIRPNISQLLNDFEELNKRYELLKKNQYKKSTLIPIIKNNIINCKKAVTFD